MATIKTLPIINDSGSQDLAQLVHSYNHLVDVVGDLITGLKTVADEAATHALATLVETALQNNVMKFKMQPDVPLAPGFKAV